MTRNIHLNRVSCRPVFILICGVIGFLVLYLATKELRGPASPPVPLTDDAGQRTHWGKLSNSGIKTFKIVQTRNPGAPGPETSKQTQARIADPDLTHLSIQEEFTQRRRTLEQGCQLYRKARGNSTSVYRGSFLVIPNKVFYCGIEKVGSTEWKNLFREMSKHNFTIQRHVNWRQALQGGDNPYQAASIKFFFVRDPFGRLLSAYVDKLFSPNEPFWSGLGTYIVKRFRPKASTLSLQCGHDVTFREFIDYVINAEKTGVYANGHFTPQFKHCHVCDFPYDYIGHLETFKEDKEFLLDAMQSPVPDFLPDFPQRSLEKQVSFYVNDYKFYKDCITMDEALRRLWQKMKIRGHLLAEMDFPLTFNQTLNISEQAFFEIASKAVEASQKLPSNLTANKRLALKEAFDTVPLSQKRQLVDLFRWDFELFGYDKYPQEVFGSSTQNDEEKGQSHLYDLYRRN